MRKILAMGASVAMLLATAAPVFATVTSSTTIFDNNISAKANSGLNTQDFLFSGGTTQSMTTGTSVAIGTQGITVSNLPTFSSSSVIQGNNIKAKANSGLNSQTVSLTGGVTQRMTTGEAGASGIQSITSKNPSLFGTTNISWNDIKAKANSGLNTQDSSFVLGSTVQSMTTNIAQAEGTQWIVTGAAIQ